MRIYLLNFTVLIIYAAARAVKLIGNALNVLVKASISLCRAGDNNNNNNNLPKYFAFRIRNASSCQQRFSQITLASCIQSMDIGDTEKVGENEGKHKTLLDVTLIVSRPCT